MKVHHFLFAAICILLMAISCQKEPQVVKVESVSLNSTSMTMVEGDSQSLTATVSPSNADNKKVIWSSSNSSVATVDDRGTVTAIASGTATITAKSDDGGKTATCSVTVNSRVISVESVSLDKTTAEITEGETITLTATIKPENATNKNVIWSSSNEEIATVKDGVVTANKEGEATITAKTEDGGKTATCSVTVNSRAISVESVSLDKTELELLEGDKATLVATVLPENADNKNVIWTSSDESVATVKDGVVTAIKEGEATITAKTEDGGKTATCSVTVIAKSKVKALCFTADGEQSISLKNGGGNAPSLQYSYNGKDWRDWDYSALTFGTNEHKFVFIRGNNPNGFSHTLASSSSFDFSTSCEVQCAGNVMHLLNYSEDLTEIPNDYCFVFLFNGCTSLVTAPELPATTLAEDCYDAMFSGCTSLQTAPDLPATTLDGSCYYQMFYGCTSLVTAPELPATTLDGSCYSSMFYGCTSLVTAPELPVTTLAYMCYSHMFYGCTSLVNVPELPATTLAYSCYYGMFKGCSSLQTAPELPATTLTEHCYIYMFSDCTSLVTAPELPATTLAEYCYWKMFSGCTSLVSAPELPATTMADWCYGYMFSGCTSLVTAPELPATTLVDYCYHQMFNGCSNLNYVKALFKTTPSATYTQDWLSGVSSTGTFVKSKNATWDVKGPNGIPSGWTVQIAE